MKCYITGVGVSGPGLPDWRSAAAVLSGAEGYVFSPNQSSGRSPLAGPERRRATGVTRLALEVAMEAAGSDRANWDIPTVFASSGGEVETCHVIFEQLAKPERIVSPTQFHNSVHNAASGYWGIASGSHQPSTSLACFDDTFSAALLESVAMMSAGFEELLLVAFDCPPPDPIGPFRALLAPFAVALRLRLSWVPGVMAGLELGFAEPDGAVPTTMLSRDLEDVRTGNPAARALPLLAALARGEDRVIHLDCIGPSLLRARVSP
jgi:Beta-ketoacyl synthase, N-terminal domain